MDSGKYAYFMQIRFYRLCFSMDTYKILILEMYVASIFRNSSPSDICNFKNRQLKNNKKTKKLILLVYIVLRSAFTALRNTNSRIMFEPNMQFGWDKKH